MRVGSNSPEEGSIICQLLTGWIRTLGRPVPAQCVWHSCPRLLGYRSFVYLCRKVFLEKFTRWKWFFHKSIPGLLQYNNNWNLILDQNIGTMILNPIKLCTNVKDFHVLQWFLTYEPNTCQQNKLNFSRIVLYFYVTQKTCFLNCRGQNKGFWKQSK